MIEVDYEKINSAIQINDLNLLKKYVENGISLESAISAYKATPLIVAVQAGRQEIFEYLIEAGADIHATDQDKATALHWAAWEGYVAMVKTLLRRGADVHALTDSNRSFSRTPLYYANSAEITALLVEHGAHINRADRNGKTPLHVMVSRRNLPNCEFLIEHGALVNVQDDYGETPLFDAAARGYIEIFETLLRHGANLWLPKKNGDTIMECCPKNILAVIEKNRLTQCIEPQVSESHNTNDAPEESRILII